MPAAIAHVRPLVYSLCEQRKLPILVTDHIARYLDEQDVLAISHISRRLNRQANVIVYKDIILDFSEERTRQRAILLLRTLTTTPTVACNIRSLSLIGEPLYRWKKETTIRGESFEAPLRGQSPPEILLDLTAFAPKELELYYKTASPQTTAHCSDSKPSLPLLKLSVDVISLLQHTLDSLSVSSDYFRYPGFRERLRSMFDTGGFWQLQHCSLCTDIVHDRHWTHINAVRDWDDTLLKPFSVPDISTMEAVTTLNSTAVNLMRESSIERLILHHCQIQDFDLDGLLAATPRLRYLEYNASVDLPSYKEHWSLSGMSRSLGLDPLFKALHHVRNTLEELITSQEFSEDSHHFESSYGAGRPPPFRQCYELSNLESLHTLVVPYAAILGWKPKDHLTFDWHKILPASLQYVTFTDDLYDNFAVGGWTEQSLMPVFNDVASYLATASRGDERPTFTLRLLWTDSEFHEPARQALSSMCEGYGVLCTVDDRLWE